MRIVVDTNIIFSSILNTNSKISKIILQPKSKLNLYSTDQLENELVEHRSKLKRASKYSEIELHKTSALVISKIKFISVEFIPKNIFIKAECLARDMGFWASGADGRSVGFKSLLYCIRA